MPPDIPVEHINCLEEDACYAFHTLQNDWSGIAVWRRAGFFRFEPDSMVLNGLDP